MEYGLKSCTAGGGGVVRSLFLKCNLGGRTYWMTDTTQGAKGRAGSASITIVMGPPLSFFQTASTVTGLHGLEGNLLRNYFRLQKAERNLSSRVKQRKRGGGRQAIRQMERERQRLGRELHTGVGQLLAVIRMQLEVIATQLPSPAATLQQALDGIAALANEALEQVRSISKRLHPPEWQRLTLESALQQLWDLSGIPQRLEATLHLEPLAQQPEQEVKVLFYRAAQEALSNLIRHAQASRIEMQLSPAGDRVMLRIQDNGVGFNVAKLSAAPASVASGIGLRSIREQAEAIDGKLQIESGPQGTTLIVTAPFTPSEN